MIHPRSSLPGCRIPLGAGECLPECRHHGRCRAHTLLLVDGRTVVGRPLGVVGETLRFLSVFPERGPVLLPFREVEPLSLHENLRCCTDPADGEGLVRLAELCAARGLVQAALGELERAVEADPGLEPAVRERRERLLEEAAERLLDDAREHLAAGRVAHARAALDEVLRRFPATEKAVTARALRRTLTGSGAAGGTPDAVSA